MGVAQLVRRAARPAAMVGVTGLLSLGMVTSGGSVAEANAGLLAAPIIEGATAALLEESLPLVGTGPTGMIVVGALGLAAATSNIWVPWVLDAASKWGSSSPNTASTPTTTQTRHDIVSAMVSQDNTTITANYANSTPFSQDWYAYFGVVAHCKATTASPDGTFKTGYESSSGYWSIGGRDATSWNFSHNFSPCPLGYVITGYVAGGGQDLGSWSPNLNTSQPYPAQVDVIGNQYSFATKSSLKWGDMGGTAAFDPQSGAVKLHTAVECLRDDGTKFTVTADSTGDQKSIQVPSCGPHAHATGKVNVTADSPSGLGQPVWTRPAVAPDTAHPLCDPTIAGPLCQLQILIDGKPCVEGQAECLRWAQLAKTNPERVQCMYGPYAVALKNCNVLERAYEPGGAVGTSPNTDGDPSTRSDADPLGNPQTVPDPGTDPGSVPRAAPAPTVPGGFPTGGTNPAPANPDDICLKDRWSWTPVDWVLKPVGCALQDAFVPKTDIQAESNKLRDDSQTKVPFAWLSTPVTAPGGGGCPNWVINVGAFHQNVVCDSSYTAALRGIRTPLFGIVAAAMVWPLLRGIWYACIPVLRVTPGSSK